MNEIKDNENCKQRLQESWNMLTDLRRELARVVVDFEKLGIDAEHTRDAFNRVVVNASGFLCLLDRDLRGITSDK